MKRRLSALKPLMDDQALAADPQVHVTLSASAGTGKTHVLTARVLRLLLGGVAPETILCLTFTKAGAAEMANRIGARLAAWVRMGEADLKKELFALGEPNDPAMLQRARRLFARVLDAPGRLRIQTLPAFGEAGPVLVTESPRVFLADYDESGSSRPAWLWVGLFAATGVLAIAGTGWWFTSRESGSVPDRG